MTLTLTIPSWHQSPAFWVNAAFAFVSTAVYAAYLNYAPQPTPRSWEFAGASGFLGIGICGCSALLELVKVQRWMDDR